jgi:exodeoxyribonuclease VII small subunit
MVKKYSQLQQELESIINRLESEALDIDEAVKLHEKGQKLISELKIKLKKAKNEITKEN